MRKLILDLDMGIDDAMALCFALASPEVELVGITCVFGNVPVGVSARNCLDVLHLLGHDDIPVIVGADRPLAGMGPHRAFQAVHGANGIGGVELERARREVGRPDDPARGDAARFIVQAAQRYGGDLLVVPTGPLTNIAHALELDARAMTALRGTTFMGGALTVPGNVTPAAEANIAADPEAAARVLSSGMPLTMVGLDVTHRVAATRGDIAGWRALGTDAGAAFAQMVESYIDAYEAADPWIGGCALHDPLAVAVALDPALAVTYETPLAVDLTGPLRGRTIGDEPAWASGAPGVEVALDVDATAFLDRFRERMACGLSA